MSSNYTIKECSEITGKSEADIMRSILVNALQIERVDGAVLIPENTVFDIWESDNNRVVAKPTESDGNVSLIDANAKFMALIAAKEAIVRKLISASGEEHIAPLYDFARTIRISKLFLLYLIEASGVDFFGRNYGDRYNVPIKHVLSAMLWWRDSDVIDMEQTATVFGLKYKDVYTTLDCDTRQGILVEKITRLSIYKRSAIFNELNKRHSEVELRRLSRVTLRRRTFTTSDFMTMYCASVLTGESPQKIRSLARMGVVKSKYDEGRLLLERESLLRYNKSKGGR